MLRLRVHVHYHESWRVCRRIVGTLAVGSRLVKLVLLEMLGGTETVEAGHTRVEVEVVEMQPGA